MEPNQTSGLFELEVDDISSRNLVDAFKWAKFLAIAGITGLGLILIFFLAYGVKIINALSQVLPGFEGDAAFGVISAVIVIFILIFGLLAYLLLRASTLIHKGIAGKNTEVFNNGLASLKIYFIIYGVVSVLSLLMNFISLF